MTAEVPLANCGELLRSTHDEKQAQLVTAVSEFSFGTHPLASVSVKTDRRVEIVKVAQPILQVEFSLNYHRFIFFDKI